MCRTERGAFVSSASRLVQVWQRPLCWVAQGGKWQQRASCRGANRRSPRLPADEGPHNLPALCAQPADRRQVGCRLGGAKALAARQVQHQQRSGGGQRHLDHS